MAITEQTTLAQLQVELSLVGSPTLTLVVEPKGTTRLRLACLHHAQGFFYGTGDTIAQAIHTALVELRIGVATKLAEKEPTR